MTTNHFNHHMHSYENFAEAVENNNTVMESQTVLPICDELEAVLALRHRYSDKKIYGSNRGYYRPVDIAIVSNTIKPLFLGLLHTNKNINYGIPAFDTIFLTEALTSFLTNSLSVHRAYRNPYFEFSVNQRNSEYYLSIDYGDEIKKSYLNKYMCRVVSSKIKYLMSHSDIQLEDKSEVI